MAAMAVVRHAVLADADPIAGLITELGYPTTCEAMKTRLAGILADPNYATFVAETDAGVVAVAGATVDRYYEKDRGARALGIGRQLVDAAERGGASKSAREMFVNSGFNRTDAHAFYEHCGYSRTGFRFVKNLKPKG